MPGDTPHRARRPGGTRHDPLLVAVELREEGEALHGVIIQEGRAATGGRAEVFAPNSVEWPSGGIAILDGHGGTELGRAMPSRGETGEIRISTPATDAIRAAIRAGRRFMSVEFRALAERTTRGGVREVLRAMVDAAALVANPEYDTTAAEVRDAPRRRIWL